MLPQYYFINFMKTVNECNQKVYMSHFEAFKLKESTQNHPSCVLFGTPFRMIIFFLFPFHKYQCNQHWNGSLCSPHQKSIGTICCPYLNACPGNGLFVYRYITHALICIEWVVECIRNPWIWCICSASLTQLIGIFFFVAYSQPLCGRTSTTVHHVIMLMGDILDHISIPINEESEIPLI